MKKLFAVMALLLLVISSVSALDEMPMLFGNEGSSDFVDTQNITTCIDCKPTSPMIDVVFLIDSTGSMNDEIREVKTHIINLVDEVQNGFPRPDIRVGIVTYRDYPLEEREYVVKSYDLTRDTQGALNFLKGIRAEGGGDYPEAVADGMQQAINDMDWNDNARKIIFMVGDASPHGEGSEETHYQQGSPNGYDYKTEIENAIDKNIVIYTVSGSGIDAVGIRIWKEIAEKTGGQYEALSYVRRDVDQYYEEENIDPAFKADAKADSDYDRKTNSILTNTIGLFTKSAMKAEASSLGVRYNEQPEDKNSNTGHKNVISEEPRKESGNLLSFFKSVFDKIIFWN